MNFFQAEINHLERRIKRIEENPDSRKMQSNKLLYEIWRDHRKSQNEAWQEGKPFIYFSGTHLSGLAEAMGFGNRLIAMMRDADRATFDCQRYIAIAQAHGFPSDACGRVQTGFGMVLAGDIPAPSFVAISDGGCQSVCQFQLWVARHFKVPCWECNHPRVNNYEAVRYLTEQLQEAIRLAEREVPGIRYDEEMLVRCLERREQVLTILDTTIEARKAKPCPLSGKDVMHQPPTDLSNPAVLDYYRRASNEMFERIKQGKSAVRKEKLRVEWLVTGPFYTDLFAFLESRDVAVPLFESGAGVRFLRRYGDDTEYGRHLTPLEEVAAEMLSLSWRGPAEWRVNEILTRCRQCQIDALVHFHQSGCITNMGTAKILADRAEEELGIPTLFLDGCCQDKEKYNRVATEAKLQAFIDFCLERKKGTS